MAQFQRIEASETMTRAGESPSRIVLNKVVEPGDAARPYCTHVEVFPEDRPAYLIWGHYDMALGEAAHDFNNRFAKESAGRIVVGKVAS